MSSHDVQNNIEDATHTNLLGFGNTTPAEVQYTIKEEDYKPPDRWACGRPHNSGWLDLKNNRILNGAKVINLSNYDTTVRRECIILVYIRVIEFDSIRLVKHSPLVVTVAMHGGRGALLIVNYQRLGSGLGMRFL